MEDGGQVERSKQVIYLCSDCGKRFGCLASQQSAFIFCFDCTIPCQRELLDSSLDELVEKGVLEKDASELCEDCDLAEFDDD